MSGILTLIAVAKAKRGGGGGVTPTGTKEISIVENGTTTHDVTNYASAEVTVNVPTPTPTDYLAALLGDALTSYVITSDSIKGHTFRGATSLTSVTFPAVLQTIGDYAFTGSGLTTAVLHSVGTMGTYTFSSTQLNAVDITSLSEINTNAFNGCSSLDVIVLRGDSVTSLRNINALANTPFASGKSGGTLYVPQSLISSYQSASNWSTILGYASNSIVKIEGSAYENAYVDGTPIS